ncbi:hypothetical protein BE20_13500 [Sorangium cellulosum]|uniref:Uncharacterized protein n=1 Tax=Sorangium cellulosum TaxID=56 RepID=A0A150SD14_SORCE|nr:hypothetical protein BE18_17460 [Sorangium cellulosum]KYF91873.1 hypothetical protein BE20_13500 [Sorangium cellulosum]
MEAPVAAITPAVVRSAPDAGATILFVAGAAVVEALGAPERVPCFLLLTGPATLFWGGAGAFRRFGRRSEEAFAAGRPGSVSIAFTARRAVARCSSWTRRTRRRISFTKRSTRSSIAFDAFMAGAVVARTLRPSRACAQAGGCGSPVALTTYPRIWLPKASLACAPSARVGTSAVA